MRVIAICNQKGGVGKSTTAEAFASSLVRRGARVLCVDMDAQPGNMSLHAGADKTHAGARELLSIKKPTREEVLACIQGAGPFGDICSADRDLEDIDAELASRVGRELALSRALTTISDNYDFAVVDTPPALWVRTLNAIAAADDVVVPTRADVSSVAGMDALVGTVDLVREVVPHPIDIAGILVTDYDARTTLAREMDGVIRTLAAGLGAPVFGAHVRHAVAASKAQRHAVPLGDFDASAGVSADYERFVDEYLAGTPGGGRWLEGGAR